MRGIGSDASRQIVIQRNTFKNMVGHTGGKPQPQSDFIQLGNMSSGGNKILCNLMENFAADGARQEDAINFYRFGGIAGDPVLVAGNKIRGAGWGHSSTGGLFGDGDASTGNYIVWRDNIHVNNGIVGISASGQHSQVLNNKVYVAPGTVGFDGSKPGVGIRTWKWSGAPKQACNDITVSGNQVNSPGGGFHSGGSSCTNIRESGNNWKAPINESIWNETPAVCGPSVDLTAAPQCMETPGKTKLTWTSSEVSNSQTCTAVM
jgi:hypothetical protein